MRWLVLSALLAVAARPAVAGETRRVAVIVGHNAGAGDRLTLRFAEDDAAKMARVLAELGGFSDPDVYLLLGRSRAAVTAAFDEVKNKIAGWKRDPTTRVVLLFYYSGHSDGQALELGTDRLEFGLLRRWLQETGATVRLAIVDSCNSGALIGEKGGHLGPKFDIRFTDDVASTGEALLTSSAAQELALESQEIRGSFFSHHLISGLRGAADSSGDGRITLTEAYRYAFVHTTAATSSTLAGPQHPVYDYRLSGQGEVVLTEVLRRSASLELPPGFDRIVVHDEGRGQLLAEVVSDGARRLAVPPGRYRVIGLRAERSYSTRVALRQHEDRVLAATELVAVPLERTSAKGAERSSAVLLTGGATAGVAREAGPRAAVRFGWQRESAGGWEAALTLATGQGAGFREQSALLGGGYGVGRWAGPLFGRASLQLGGGAVLQSIDGRGSAWSPAAFAGPCLSGGARLGARLGLVAQACAPEALLRRDDRLALVLLPGVMAGVMLWP